MQHTGKGMCGYASWGICGVFMEYPWYGMCNAVKASAHGVISSFAVPLLYFHVPPCGRNVNRSWYSRVNLQNIIFDTAPLLSLRS